MLTIEFQAVVLAAGRGTRLPEFSADHPKCLLPIGPFPLLFYPLHTLQQHNFQEVIVIVLESQKSEIQQAIERTPIKLKLDYVSIPNDSDFGTADSLRYIHEKIKSDLIIMSCDVVSNVCLYPFVNLFRQNNASIVSLLFKGGFEAGITVPGPKSKHKPERDLIGLHPNTNRLLFLASTSDFEETLNMSGHLLRKYGKIQIFSRLVDSHIYLMKKWTINFLLKKENLSTLKGEFIPYIVKKQMAKTIQPSTEAISEAGVNLKPENDIFNYATCSNLEKQIISSSLYNESQLSEPYSGDVIRCYAFKAPKDIIGLRINTSLLYYAINQKIAILWPLLVGNNYPLISALANNNCTQSKDISVAENVNLSAKTSLTSSIFGPYCNVESKVKVSNSIIMGYATIEEGCVIENSVICNKAKIKKRSQLKNCIVGPNYVVEEESEKQQQHLTNADGYMEIE